MNPMQDFMKMFQESQKKSFHKKKPRPQSREENVKQEVEWLDMLNKL